MTAIDVATQARLLGAQEVTIAYRRGRENMNASNVEQNQSSSKGVTIRHWMKPAAVTKTDTGSLEVKLEFTALSGGKLVGTGKFQTIEVIAHRHQADTRPETPSAMGVENGRIAVDEVWTQIRRSGQGDCVAAGEANRHRWRRRDGRSIMQRGRLNDAEGDSNG